MNDHRRLSSPNCRVFDDCEAIRTVIRMNVDNIFVKSDSQVTVSFIMSKIDAPKQISNLVGNTNFIVKNIKNITSLIIVDLLILGR